MGDAQAASNRNALKRAIISLIILAVLAGLLFLFDLEAYYFWIKAVHIIAVISWMAGMLYLPRLFVYHCSAQPGSDMSETFKIMERRLLRAIINPAMMVAWVFGLWLAWHGFDLSGGWLLTKIALVVGMSAIHGYFAYAVRLFSEDRNTRTSMHWRVMNEVPTLLMIVIVVLVTIKPF